MASHKMGMLGKRIGKGIAPKSSAKLDRFTPECLTFGFLRHAVNVGRVAFFDKSVFCARRTTNVAPLGKDVFHI